MEVPLRELTYGPCPYLSSAPRWKVSEFSLSRFSPELYEELLAKGYRRSGTSFYRTNCDGCDRCIPLRLDVEHFEPTASQRRVIRRNQTTELRFDPHANRFREDRFRLYEAYCQDRHGRAPGAEEEPFSYMAFLVESPLGDVAVTEYRVPLEGGDRLVGNGYLDVLPEGLSSVYFAWDTEFRRLSLGTLSIIREIELCGILGKRWYYLGFWVPGSPSMDYKAGFGPAQIARNGAWLPLTKEVRDTLREIE